MKKILKSILLLISLLSIPFSTFAQLEIDGNPLNEEQKIMVKEVFSRQKMLSNVGVATCLCIDSISINNATAKQNASEIKRCIDNEVVGYQTSLTILKAVDVKEGHNATMTIFTNPASEDYKKFYYEIEKQVMDSCQPIRNVVGANNQENKKSVSTKSPAITEYNNGNNFLREKNYAEALPFYEKAVKIDPDFVFAWDNIGVCNRNLGNYDAAIKAYKKSIKLDPTAPTAYQNMGLAYVGKKDYKKAIESYKELSKLDDKNPEVYYGMALIYYYNLSENEMALDNMCKAYNLYIEQNSPYRTDAQKVIQSLYSDFKQEGKEVIFDKILTANNISRN